jgi:hypothetical protein
MSLLQLETSIKYLKAQSQQLNYWFSHGSVNSATSSTATRLFSEYSILSPVPGVKYHGNVVP